MNLVEQFQEQHRGYYRYELSPTFSDVFIIVCMFKSWAVFCYLQTKKNKKIIPKGMDLKLRIINI